ncbi:cobalamin biosynthesis protein [Streptomyces sp. TLI_171]|uniref:cobalamin biosynthesis protein n=1 Tax=Streptomyces sp. TLI_171 TaxID=1938859 RepID=UPI000C4C7D4C|nr:cobalamin biosynthesis protein [Streptomyces sp. TLI_171]RKE21737.1 cobalt-precorrin 5A hydrolase [Streptomyces sp. TLI_171]
MAGGSDALSPAARVVLGVGLRRGAPAAELLRTADAALTALGLDRTRVALLATLDAKLFEPGLRAAAQELDVPLVGHPAAGLAAVEVPTRSARVAAAVGTPSVAEAAALASAGPGGRLLAPRTASASATVAVAALAHQPQEDNR